MKRTLPWLAAGLFTAPVIAAPEAENLAQELEKLKAENRAIMERLDATAAMVEQQTRPAGMGHHGKAGRTTVGGYGELHYNNLDNKTSGGKDKKELDFHRFVLFFGHEFTDKIRFHSELEVEHALTGGGTATTVDDANTDGIVNTGEVSTGKDGKPGEVELEQAYVEFDINDSLSAKGGIFLIPAGIINETHEPPTFYGVERNNVEKNIIPTTWWEAGAAITGRFANAVSYDVAVHSGLNTSGPNYKIRDGRQKAAEAKADDLAYTLRVKWTGIPGLELAATLQHQNDITQGSDATAGAADLIEAHAVWQKGNLGLRALYASWDLDGSGPKAKGADEQTGFYLEPSWRINPKWGVFARYSEWDNQAGDSADSEYTQIDAGFNYWPHNDVVIKVDYQDQDVPSGKDELDGINIGIGYQF